MDQYTRALSQQHVGLWFPRFYTSCVLFETTFPEAEDRSRDPRYLVSRQNQ
jgi:hypothetical protein